MHGTNQPYGLAVNGAWLYVAELVHRVGNEYASAIAELRVASARSTNSEARSAMLNAVGRLRAFADAHWLLRPPNVMGRVDLADHLSKLCGAMAFAQFTDRRLGLSIEVPQPIVLDSSRCWRAGLIVSELITNAARHAFGSAVVGEISVSVTSRMDQVICRVADTGVWRPTGTPGLGSALVHSLAADLNGHLARRTDATGTTVELIFPASAAACPFSTTDVGRVGEDVSHAFASIELLLLGVPEADLTIEEVERSDV